MPFFKTFEVSREFFKLFLSGTTKKSIAGDNRPIYAMLPMPIFTGETTDVHVRFAKRSGDSSIEDTLEYYPCIAIQNFQPEIDKRIVFGQKYIEGFKDLITGTREMIYLPIPMIFRFQVSVVSRREKHVSSINDWMLQNFDMDIPNFLLLNRVDTEEGPVGDVVEYSAKQGEVPREDGRFEYVYDFMLNVFLHAKSKKYKFAEDVPAGSSLLEGQVIGGNFGDMLMHLKASMHTRQGDELQGLLAQEFEIY